MKTKTHYLYSFIIVSLLVALVITSVSKPTPKPIETTPPVEITTEMVTLPPSDTDDTNENEEKIYDDTYYTIAIYLFYFCCFSFISYGSGATIHDYRYTGKEDKQNQYEDDIGQIYVVIIILYILSFIFAIISLSLETLDKYQKSLMILYTIFVPSTAIVGGILSVITSKRHG